MNKISRCDIIVCDIDNTLIHGWMTDFMDWTWKVFESPKLAKVLGWIQYKLKLYKVNKKVLQLLINSEKYIYFLTARGKTSFLSKLINNIIPPWIDYEIVELGSWSPPEDKRDWIFHNLWMSYYSIIFIDDSAKNRKTCGHLVHCVDPRDIEKDLL